MYIYIYFFFNDGIIFQVAREAATQVVPRLVLSHIPLEFRNKLFSLLPYRKEIQKCRNANAEKLYGYISTVPQECPEVQHMEQLSQIFMVLQRVAYEGYYAEQTIQ